MPARLTFDHLIVAVADLDSAVGAWSALLGRRPSWRGSHPAMGTRNALYRLGDAYHELLAADPGASAPLASMVREVLGPREERPLGFAIGTSDIDARVGALRAAGIAVLDPASGEGVESTSGARRTWRSALVDPGAVRGLRLLLIEHTSPPSSLPLAAPLDGDDAAIANGLDHVVVFTADLAASRDLWVRSFGLEIAWSRDFPERGTRNLGLQLGNVILELVERSPRVGAQPPSSATTEPRPARGRDDFVWGAAWRVGDCARAVARIGVAGLEVDPARPGLESGTTVATVRWPRTPTLLLSRP